MLLFPAFEIQLPHFLSVKRVNLELGLQSEADIFEAISYFRHKVVRFILDLNEYVSTVAICMNEIILHQHLKESSWPESSDDFVHRMPVSLVVADGNTFDESLNKYWIFSTFLEGRGEVHVAIFLEHFVENIEISHLKGEVDLISQCFL